MILSSAAGQKKRHDSPDSKVKLYGACFNQQQQKAIVFDTLAAYSLSSMQEFSVEIIMRILPKEGSTFMGNIWDIMMGKEKWKVARQRDGVVFQLSDKILSASKAVFNKSLFEGKLTAFNDSRWHHYGISLGAPDSKGERECIIALDGRVEIIKMTNTPPTVPDSSFLQIGGVRVPVPFYIAEVRLWKKALKNADFARYSGSLNMNLSDLRHEGLLSYWVFSPDDIIEVKTDTLIIKNRVQGGYNMYYINDNREDKRSVEQIAFPKTDVISTDKNIREDSVWAAYMQYSHTLRRMKTPQYKTVKRSVYPHKQMRTDFYTASGDHPVLDFICDTVFVKEHQNIDSITRAFKENPFPPVYDTVMYYSQDGKPLPPRIINDVILIIDTVYIKQKDDFNAVRETFDARRNRLKDRKTRPSNRINKKTVTFYLKENDILKPYTKSGLRVFPVEYDRWLKDTVYLKKGESLDSVYNKIKTSSPPPPVYEKGRQYYTKEGEPLPPRLIPQQTVLIDTLSVNGRKKEEGNSKKNILQTF
jgi:hypothetical protein